MVRDLKRIDLYVFRDIYGERYSEVSVYTGLFQERPEAKLGATALLGR
jgi:hypothetical protein